MPPSNASADLPPFEFASDFVPESLNAADWSQLEPLYLDLLGRDLHCANCLRELIDDRSELDAAVSEAGTNLHVQMTCHTDDAAKKKAYLAFVENVLPKLKERSFELDKKVVSSPHAKELDRSRFGVLLRDLQAGVELFRPENIPLETELTKLDQQYLEVSGAMTVDFDGQTRTLQQMAKYQEMIDRSVREAAWRASAQRRIADREAIETIFDKMLALRHRVALNAGFANYRDYAMKARKRFDYGVRECDDFARGVEQAVVPAMRKLNRQRAEALGLAKLRPWDTSVDVKGRAPLRPFQNADDLVERSSRLFHRMDPSLGRLFDSLRGGGCLDLDSRLGKAPGGYQASRDRLRLPFIFMNAVGVQRDVETMVHEAGHAFHALLCRAEPIHAYRADIPLEFCEVASMSMELTCHPFMDEFYTAGDAQRACRNHLEGIAGILPWIATIDQFQHWLYSHPGHSRAERSRVWLDLLARFGGDVDWSGLEAHRESMWHRQLHLFGAPFYYIEYGIAQLGALQLYSRYKSAPADAINAYKSALRLGGSKPLPDLFTAAGLDFDFSPARISQSWRQIERDLETLPV